MVAVSIRCASAADLSPCKLPDVAQAALCGALSVPENPDRPAGRLLPIGVAVIPAAGKRTYSDPIVVLMGGPGEGAISAASVYARQFAPLLKDRDLLLVDQRGAGRSGALGCDLHPADEPETLLRDLFPPAAVERCARQLRTRADLTQYSYTRFADDLEHVRRALDYGPLNLFAGSYGTATQMAALRFGMRSTCPAGFPTAPWLWPAVRDTPNGAAA
jgi:pimeloyl-ACP methyl ester carboxylesterase